MRYFYFFFLIFFSCKNVGPTAQTISNSYIDADKHTVHSRIVLPESFVRVESESNSFAYFLQHFPVKANLSKVYYYNGEPKYNQSYHLAVLDIDTGNRDLQQCADAIIRLRAEYLFQQKQFDKIRFHFTNGFLADYMRWKDGQRIDVSGSTVTWKDSARPDSSYNQFRKYLTMVFAYAGTLSLSEELKPKELESIQIGDVFIQGGSPGHAVIVVDMAIHETNGEKIFLVAQSYMPAQDIHIIKKNQHFVYGPWYSVKEIEESFQTPEWSFRREDLKSFE